MRLSRPVAASLSAAALVLAAACGSSDGDVVEATAPSPVVSSAPAPPAAAPTEAAPTTAAPAAFTVALTGAAEVPGPGDPDGSGTAELTVDAATGEVCFDLDTDDVDDLAAGHIHAGAADAAGDVVVPLFMGEDPDDETCVTVDPSVTAAIVADPAAFYVNVHNAEFGMGALRGQLA